MLRSTALGQGPEALEDESEEPPAKPCASSPRVSLDRWGDVVAAAGALSRKDDDDDDDEAWEGVLWALET